MKRLAETCRTNVYDQDYAGESVYHINDVLNFVILKRQLCLFIGKNIDALTMVYRLWKRVHVLRLARLLFGRRFKVSTCTDSCQMRWREYATTRT